MSFFYHSNLGAAFFYILAVICIFAIWRGGKERIFALMVLYVFLCERTLLASGIDEVIMIGLGGCAAFLGLISVLYLVKGAAARTIAFLFSAKIGIYIMLICGIIGFDTMASWTEFVAYLQLLIIGAGSLHGKRSYLVRDFRGSHIPGISVLLRIVFRRMAP